MVDKNTANFAISSVLPLRDKVLSFCNITYVIASCDAKTAVLWCVVY